MYGRFSLLLRVFQRMCFLMPSLNYFLEHLPQCVYRYSFYQSSNISSNSFQFICQCIPSCFLVHGAFLAFCSFLYGLTSKSTRGQSWSETPGITSTWMTFNGVLVIIRSSVFLSLVGLSISCTRPLSSSISPKRWWRFGWLQGLSLDLFQFYPRKLKSPVDSTFSSLFPILSSEASSWSMLASSPSLGV